MKKLWQGTASFALVAAFIRGVFIEAPILSVNTKFYLSVDVRVNTKTLSDLKCILSSKENLRWHLMLSCYSEKWVYFPLREKIEISGTHPSASWHHTIF